MEHANKYYFKKKHCSHVLRDAPNQTSMPLTWIHTGMLKLLASTLHYACYVSYLSHPQNISWLHVVKILAVL